MERTERFYKIQNLLRSRHFVSTQDFLSELGISRATFKRDLEYLRDRMRAPIAYDRDQQAYGFDPAIADSQLWQLPGLWFSADELQALLTMDRLLGDLQPGVLSELIAPLRKRLRSLLESGEHSAADIARRIKILSMGSRRVAPAHFRTIATAVLTRKRLKLRHQRRQDGEVIDREVSPQRLVHYRDNWYLDAWCHKRQALRTFGLDAIATAIAMPDKDVKEIGEDTLERHYASGYGIFAGSATQDAVLQFGASSARWVSRETWHPEQVGTPQLDGTYLLQFPYAQEPELVMDILKHGADVQVLAPESLRKAVAEKLRAAAKLYD
ncbi:MAG: WYL domain-containing protein [Steroidobacteraceae bacterium]|nr:WYL domain-containing protein [Pseudomonadota bacterium]MBP6106194.1 WYL domain-containing protein [Steroidobacteraceae bacterium]MBP7014960.1 WYL domain-containing protein [Steroidobacteraceae bacterium]